MWNTNKIKYGRDFSEMLEEELMTEEQFAEKEAMKEAELRKRHPGGFIRLGGGSPGPDCCFYFPHPHYRMYEIEEKIYGVDFSDMLPIRDSTERNIGKHSDIDFFEMKGEKELEQIASENGHKIPKNRIIRPLTIRKLSKFRWPTLSLGKIIMNDLQKISFELYKPERIAEFVGIYSNDIENELIVVPKRNTHMRLVMRASGGASVCELNFPKNELEKYPVVDFYIKLKNNSWAAY